MAQKKSRIDNLHDNMPAIFNTKENVNWRALLEAMGQADQDTLDLIEAVRQQFFIKTAKRPYIDRLGAATKVQRPRFVGMDDTDFRTFIPVMSYQPKQVKLVLDNLLDLFFFKEATTSFISSNKAEPFVLQDNWELEYLVDSEFTERIQFTSAEFTDINNATANEIVASINRQAVHSYAIAFENSLTKEVLVRIFTKTVGSKGSLQITGGRANIGLQFEGFNTEAGHGVATEWQVTKVGDTVTLQFTGNGGSPKIDQVEVGDVVVIGRFGNTGSYIVTEVDATQDLIRYTNLFATEETFTQTPVEDVKFFRPFKSTVYLKDRRALVWEVQPGEIVVEMPPSPPVVKRKRAGSAHINGIESTTVNMISTTSMELKDASKFPDAGQFLFVPLNEIQTFFPQEGDITSLKFEGRLTGDAVKYTYTSKSGNTLLGISPDLPVFANLKVINLVSANRDNANKMTITTAMAADWQVDDSVTIANAVQGAGTGPSTNTTVTITKVISPFVFEAYSFGGGAFGVKASTGGTAVAERIGISNSGSRVILTSAQVQPDSLGPYMWDEDADFVLSSLTTNLTAEIKAGTTKRNIEVLPNEIPNETGQLIFDFGTEKQEGPVRYFYTPSDSAIAIDPSYVFKYTHSVGSGVTMIRRRGGIQFNGLGTEFGAYVTDPAAAREVLQELMQEVKSVGIFINFLVRYPEFYYATIDTYRSGIDPG
jgi:hypothetical protein